VFMYSIPNLNDWFSTIINIYNTFQLQILMKMMLYLYRLGFNKIQNGHYSVPDPDCICIVLG
jgi:hypothetical protein